MTLNLYPLFGLCVDPPLPPASDSSIAIALLDSPELAAAMQRAPAPVLEFSTPEPTPAPPDPNPTPTPGFRR